MKSSADGARSAHCGAIGRPCQSGFHLKYGRPGRKYARLVPRVDCMAHDIDPYLRKRL